MSKKNKISRKDKKMVELYLSDPKITKTQAYKMTHNFGEDTKQSSLHTQASDAFRKPEVKTMLAKYSGLVEDTLINTIDDWGRHDKPRQREIAIDTAKFVHDKIHGKATQRVEQTTTSLEISLDLSQDFEAEEPILDSNQQTARIGLNHLNRGRIP